MLRLRMLRMLPVLAAESWVGGRVGVPHGWPTVTNTVTHLPALACGVDIAAQTFNASVHGAAHVLRLSEASSWPTQ